MLSQQFYFSHRAPPPPPPVQKTGGTNTARHRSNGKNRENGESGLKIDLSGLLHSEQLRACYFPSDAGVM